jgi:hypothetical protein
MASREGVVCSYAVEMKVRTLRRNNEQNSAGYRGTPKKTSAEGWTIKHFDDDIFQR